MRAERGWLFWGLCCAALGGLLGASLSIAEIVAQRFAELGLWHSAVRTLVAGSRSYALVGAAVGLLLGLVGPAVGLLLGLVGRATQGISSAWLLNGGLRRKVAIVVAPLGLLAAGGVRAAGWLGPIDAVAVGLAGLVLALAILSVPLVVGSSPDTGRREANVVRWIAAVLLLLIGGYLQNRPWLREPMVTANLVGNALLLLSAASSLWLLRDAYPRRAAVVLGLLAVLWLAAPLLAAPTIRAGNPRSVLLITVDTLRFDHTSLAGQAAADPADRSRTPNLLRLERDGVSFQQAISQAPWTMPAFAAITTGLYPREHGALSLNDRIPAGVVTLAELLREAGYRTAGVVSHLFVDAHHGFAQGFDVYDERYVLGHRGLSSDGITELAVGLLEAQASARDRAPFLLFLHYFDPHFEYEDHADWDFADDYSGPLRGGEQGIEELRRERSELDARDLRYLRDLYDEEIASTDRAIGRLLDALTRLGLDDEVAVVFVADHGEEFMEHGWLGHTSSLYEEVLRVPMVFRLPGVPARGPIEVPVETRSVFPTLLDYLQLDSQLASKRGSLLPLLRGEEPDASGIVRSAVELGDLSPNSEKHVRAYVLREGPWKFVWNATLDREQLFDLSADPAERHDLAEAEPERRARMRAELDRWLAATEDARSGAGFEIDAAERERLRALGYL